MKILTFLLCLAPLAQAQSFPGAIYTPLIAKDNVQSTLSAAQASGDTVAVVASSTGFVVNMAIYICDTTVGTRCTGTFEVEKITAIAGNVLTVTRGYGGTSAIAHASGKAVLNAPTAVYNTNLNNEVLAIETALGANLSNIANGPLVSSSTYNFASQSPSSPTSLIVGANAITMVPVPLGVNGSNTGHYLRVAGTGTPEACLITGGSGTSGQSSGQIILTCAGTHSAGYTVSSATSGISEAIWSFATYGSVYIPSGAWNVYATITVPAAKQISLVGAGITAASLNLQFASGDGVLYDATTYALASIGNFRFDPQVTRTSGYDLHVKGATFGTVENLYSRNTLNAYEFENCNSIQVHNLQVQSFTGNGFFLNATGAPTSGGFYSHLSAVGAGTNAMLIQASAGNAFAGTTISDSNFQLATNLVNLFPNGGTLNEFLINNIILDTWVTRGMWLQGGSGSGNGVAVRGVRMGSSSGAGFGIGILSKWTNVLLSDITGGASGQGIVISGAKNVQISNSHISGDGSGAAGNVALTIQVDGATVADAVKVVNSSFGVAEDGTTGGGTSTTGISITAAAHTNLRFYGNTSYGNATSGTSSLANAATGAGSVFSGNNFIGHISPAVASAATLTFPAEQDYFTVTGTTGVTAVAGLIQGQRGTFVATSGAVPFTAGGTIGNSFIAPLNIPVSYTFDGTLLWATTPTPAYNAAGTLQSKSHTVFGTCVLGTSCAVTFSGAAAWTSSSSYSCTATDVTAAAAVKVVNTSASVVTFTGTGADTLSYVCVGN